MRDRNVLRFNHFSEDRKYRYTLWREWDMSNDLIATMPGYDHTHEFLNVIGLNPSTADETQDDPTIRRCIDFAQRLGFGALCMTNLFAYRGSKPRVLLDVSDPVGINNDLHVIRISRDATCGMVIAAWGHYKHHPVLRTRATFMGVVLRGLGVDLQCLRQNADGSPQHPLYITADTEPSSWYPSTSSENQK